MRKIMLVAAAAIVSVAAIVTVTTPALASKAPNVCPGGQVRFGVEPYDSGPKFVGAYKTLTGLLSKKLGCAVKLFIATNYTAEVEAMRAKKLDVGEFGPLGYIFAHQLAKAQPVAVFATKDRKPVTYTAALWVPTDSTIQTVADLQGHSIAFSDPGSTSGNLFPRYALSKAGLNPESDVKVEYAGSHTASLLALVNGKVDAGEVNSQQEATASDAGQFDTSKFRVIWRSAPIPNDPITVRGDLPAAFRTALAKALFSLTPAQLKALDTEARRRLRPADPRQRRALQADPDLVAVEGIDIKHIG